MRTESDPRSLFDEDDEEASDYREHLLIYSGFIAASSLTAIIFLIAFSKLYQSPQFGVLNIVVTLLGTSFILSAFAGFAIVQGFTERSLDYESSWLDVFGQICTLLSAVVLMTVVPFLLYPFSISSLAIVLAILVILIVVFGVLLVYKRSQG